METVNDTTPPTDSDAPYRQPGNRLTRASDDKVVSGLAGGLGRYFGIDPVVFRIAFVVLTLAGGSGILLYLIGWVMIPEDTGANALRGFGHERNQKLVAAVLAGGGLLLLLDDFMGGDDDLPVGVVLVALGGLLLWSRRNRADAGPPVPPAPPAPPTGDAEGALTPPTVTSSDAAETPETAEFAATPPSPPPPPAGPPPPADRKRSALVPVTLSLLVIMAGGLSLLGVSATTGLALALLLTGGALIVGAWRGRAKWLIPVGLGLAVALATVSVIDVPVRGGSGDVSFAPVTLEEIRSPYRLAAGELFLDLSDLDLRGQTVTLVASVAAGELRIMVPRDAAVDIDAHVGAGNLDLLGRESDGLDIGRDVAEPGPEGAGRLILRARAGLGVVEVNRALA